MAILMHYASLELPFRKAPCLIDDQIKKNLLGAH